MNATRKQINAVNEIAAKHSGFTANIQRLYEELEKIGVTVGLITNRRDVDSESWRGSAPWQINGVEVENSLFIVNCCEGYTIIKNWNFYFS